MKKDKGIELLTLQISKITDESIDRADWNQTTVAILTRVFPVSHKLKVAQIENLEKNPSHYADLSEENIIRTRNKKAGNLLTNYIEEIELLGLENKYNKMEMFFGSFRFWSILIILCTICYIGGRSSAKVPEIEISSTNPEMDKLRQEINNQNAIIKGLQVDLENERTFK